MQGGSLLYTLRNLPGGFWIYGLIPTMTIPLRETEFGRKNHRI